MSSCYSRSLVVFIQHIFWAVFWRWFWQIHMTSWHMLSRVTWDIRHQCVYSDSDSWTYILQGNVNVKQNDHKGERFALLSCNHRRLHACASHRLPRNIIALYFHCHVKASDRWPYGVSELSGHQTLVIRMVIWMVIKSFDPKITWPGKNTKIYIRFCSSICKKCKNE